MNIIERLSNYVFDKDLKLNYYQNNLNIVNYIKIIHFDNNKVKVKVEQGVITIMGSKLVVTKLWNNELLISGEIKTIELG